MKQLFHFDSVHVATSNPAGDNAILPTFQQVADEDYVAFVDRRRARIGKEAPRPPHYTQSRWGGVTRVATPDRLPKTQDQLDLKEFLRQPLSNNEIDTVIEHHFCYDPWHQYEQEDRQEMQRIYYLPGAAAKLGGWEGVQKAHIMSRHRIKERWQQLGVWDLKWGIPVNLKGLFQPADEFNWWPWLNPGYALSPIGNAKLKGPEICAARRYLQKKKEQGREAEAPARIMELANRAAGISANHDESPITSRPWFLFALEVAAEEVRLGRHPRADRHDTFLTARINVAARWQRDGYWKDSWTDNAKFGSFEDGWSSLPGWTWGHELPSPGTPDPDGMEFTPSEIDAIEAIRPPTPPPWPKPAPGASPAAWHVWKHFNKRLASDLAEQQSTPRPPDDDEDSLGRPGAVASGTAGESAHQSILEDDADMAPRAEHSRASIRGTTSPNLHRQARQSATATTTRRPLTRLDAGTTCSDPASIASPSAAGRNRKSKGDAKVIRAPIPKPKQAPPTRRSLRVAGRQRRSEGVTVPVGDAASSEPLKAKDHGHVAPRPQRNRQVKETSTRTTGRTANRAQGRRAPISPKPQGVVKEKRTGRLRR
ncbi:hypothetical protein ABEF93_003567 [Exophiala dermatitidis]